MTELSLLIFFLGVAFILAPLMTNVFFLNSSKLYSEIHKFVLWILAAGFVFQIKALSFIWLLFCLWGFYLYLRRSRPKLFSLNNIAVSISFVFSLISAIWFVAGINDLHLLGYNKTWSYYAALYGSFLGWMLVGCLAYLAERFGSRIRMERSSIEAKAPIEASEKDIVFFDGFCVLCNGTVSLLMKLDSKKALRYSSLQGEKAKQVLQPHQTESGDSVIFRSQGVSYEKSHAVIRILWTLSGPYRFVSLLLSLVPISVLNPLYDLVARYRYRVFGKQDSCRIPNKEERELFIP